MEIPSQEKLLLDITKILQDLRIDYFITGGMAISVWGRPRSTDDIDIIIKIAESQVGLLARAFREISRMGYADENMAIEAIRNKGEFNFIDSNSGLKVDFWIFDEKKNIESLKFKNRRLERFLGQDIYFVSPEDLILSKLNWYQQTQSTRHLEDIESILSISGKNLDMDYLNKWIKKLGFLEDFNKISNSKKVK